MLFVELLGVFAFALSGGLAGVRRRFDIFGILVLAVLTALGGGMVRDVLLGITPPRGISDLNLIVTALVGGLVTFWFSGTLARARRVILVADALGLGAFAVAAGAAQRVPDLVQGMAQAAALAGDARAHEEASERATRFAATHRGAAQATARAIVAMVQPEGGLH